MSRLSRRIEKLARRSNLAGRIPSTATYQGSNGAAWFVGSVSRAPSFAQFFCGDDVRLSSEGHVSRRQIPKHVERMAADGGLVTFDLTDADAGLSSVVSRSIEVPSLVDIHVDLPGDASTVSDALLTSTTREDFRRIRKAGFTYRVTTDPEVIRQFHARHVTPLIETQFPDDGNVGSVDKMVASLRTGGELVCADLDGEWVAGIMNTVDETTYALISLGIRDADNEIRQKRVVAALIIRSLERAAELGLRRATLGRSLPFLGKGPVWFKVKWGGVITRRPNTKMLGMVLNLQSASVRRMLAQSPIIHSQGDALVASVWLDPGERPLHELTRDSGRFPGITKWHVLAENDTIAAGAEMLSTNPVLVPTAVDPSVNRPIWLGEVLSEISGDH